MDNFNIVASDQLPQFLCKSVRKKAKLSVCQFTFKQNIKANLLNNRKKSFSHIPISTQLRNQSSQSPNQSPVRYRSINTIQQKINKNPSLQHFTEQEYEKDKNQINFLSPFKFRSQPKLPTLNKCFVQLNIEQTQEDKFIRVKKQATKIKLGKMHGNYRQLSQRNQVLRIKQQDKDHKDPEQNQNIVSSPSKIIKDPQKQRCYFIRNLMLNSSHLMQVENKQRASLNLLVSKLKQTERRVSRLNPNILDKKLQQNSPAELRTNKMHYEELAKNTMKEQIMKRFTKKVFKVNEKQIDGHTKGKNKQENYVSGWNNAIEEHQQF